MQAVNATIAACQQTCSVPPAEQCPSASTYSTVIHSTKPLFKRGLTVEHDVTSAPFASYMSIISSCSATVSAGSMHAAQFFVFGLTCIGTNS